MEDKKIDANENTKAASQANAGQVSDRRKFATVLAGLAGATVLAEGARASNVETKNKILDQLKKEIKPGQNLHPNFQYTKVGSYTKPHPLEE